MENNPFNKYKTCPTNGATIYAFVGPSYGKRKLKHIPEHVKIVRSQYKGKDSADICMQIHVGGMLAKKQFDRYVIVTKDHFGEALRDIITVKDVHLVKEVECLADFL